MSKKEIDIAEILELVKQAYKAAGKELKTAVLVDGDETTLLEDNRKPEEIN